MEDKHPHSKLIDAAGPEAVRRTLGITPAVLSNWRRRGVPAAQRAAFARLLIIAGHAVPPDILDAETVQALRLARAQAELAAVTGKPVAMSGEGFAA
jgi:hypothetical protein